MQKIKGYLTDTCTNAEHPRVKELQEQLEIAAREKGGELRSISVMEPGVVVIDITTPDAEKFVVDSLGKLSGVTITPITGFEMQFQRNQSLQSKIDKKRETKKQKKSS
jgi:hypothetical protein